MLYGKDPDYQQSAVCVDDYKIQMFQTLSDA